MKILRLTTLLDFGGQEKQYLSFTEQPELLKHHYVFAAIGFGGNAEETLRKRGFEVHILNQPFAIKNMSNSGSQLSWHYCSEISRCQNRHWRRGGDSQSFFYCAKSFSMGLPLGRSSDWRFAIRQKSFGEYRRNSGKQRKGHL